ncbi:MAG TPA: rod shape-determining protein [Candidatus Paceibacterota bacterium]|nr:rod shape-determining protein [Candidatus Paceibacterota bacterium]
MARKIGIDLGTTNTVVFVPAKGIVINEPSVVAVSVVDNRIIAVGNAAKDMIGRTPDSIDTRRPLTDGAIADYRVATAMLRSFIKRASGPLAFMKPEVLISVPAGITSAERRALIEAALSAGARQVFLVKEPVLAAIGARVPINSPIGNMILNIGGGTTELAVISLGGIVSTQSLRIGGNKFDIAIVEYIQKKHGLAIGERTAELIKINIGTAVRGTAEDSINIKGRDLTTGLPKTVAITSNEVSEALADHLREILQMVKNVLELTPPELCSDIMDRGITISGGGALLRNIDVLVTKSTGVPARIAEDPLFCVARGAGIVLENLETYKRNVIAKR